MDSYFFIPASNQKFVAKIETLHSKFFVLDLEDAIHSDEIQTAIELIKSIQNKDCCYVRIPISHEHLSTTIDLLGELQSSGYHQFVFPKFQLAEEVGAIVDGRIDLTKHRQILLVEHPRLLMNLSTILAEYPFFGVALGSHDYSSSMNMKHTSENLLWARQSLLNNGKAYGKTCIDTASMNITDRIDFRQECQQAYDLGFEGKMLIHPLQLEVLNSSTFYSSEDRETALLLKDKIEEIGGIDRYTLFRINNKVIEKPHLKKYLSILEKEGLWNPPS